MAFLPENQYERRKVTNFLVVHCSATPASADIGVEQIREWHIKERKFKDVGYHYIIRRDGTRELGRPTWAVGAHVEKHNFESVAICLVGGAPHDNPQTPENETLTRGEDNFTLEQFSTLSTILYYLKRDSYKDAQVVGHHDIEVVTHKQCPAFNVKEWWAADEKTVQKEIKSNACIAR